MGIADSPLHGKVLFIEGPPRSGTSWLINLVSAHPEIAGIASESHLFPKGVFELLKAHEEPNWGVTLAAFVGREELYDRVRDLCDAIFMSMRERVKPGAPFVAEKTPLLHPRARAVMERKLRCYPDAWYLHLTRDEGAITRSLVNAPFVRNRSEEQLAGLVAGSTAAIREVLAGHPRYRELAYADLVDDPATALAGVFEWVGVDAGEEVRERMRTLSAERFAKAVPDAPQRSRPRLTPRRVAGGLVRRARRLVRRGAPEVPAAGLSPADRLIRAMVDGDADAVRDITGDSFALELRTGEGDLRVEGEEARAALLQVGELLFTPRFINVDWRPAEAGSAYTFQALTGDAGRVDAALQAFARNGQVLRLTVIAAGDLEGRPMKPWKRPGDPDQ